MVSPFETVVQKMVEIGFYSYVLPFIISAVIFYAVLKKSKILSESPIINGSLAIAIALVIFGSPVILGFSIEQPLVAFFTQATMFLFIFLMAIVMASFFYPDLQKFLAEHFARRTQIWIMIAVGFTLFVTSGLVSVFWAGAGPTEPGKTPGPPQDVILIVAGVIIFVVVVMIAAAIGGASGGKSV